MESLLFDRIRTDTIIKVKRANIIQKATLLTNFNTFNSVILKESNFLGVILLSAYYPTMMINFHSSLTSKIIVKNQYVKKI